MHRQVNRLGRFSAIITHAPRRSAVSTLQCSLFDDASRTYRRLSAVATRGYVSERAPPLILDGGMTQELIAALAKLEGSKVHDCHTHATRMDYEACASGLHQAGVPRLSLNALANHPDLIRDMHMKYIQAGAHVITTSNFSVIPQHVARLEDAARFGVEELTERAARLAYEARERMCVKIVHQPHDHSDSNHPNDAGAGSATHTTGVSSTSTLASSASSSFSSSSSSTSSSTGSTPLQSQVPFTYSSAVQQVPHGCTFTAPIGSFLYSSPLSPAASSATTSLSAIPPTTLGDNLHLRAQPLTAPGIQHSLADIAACDTSSLSTSSTTSPPSPSRSSTSSPSSGSEAEAEECDDAFSSNLAYAAIEDTTTSSEYRYRGARVLIAGCIPPLVECISMFGAARTPEIEAQEVRFLKSVVARLDPFVDLYICESLVSIPQALQAARMAMLTDKPVWVSWRLKDDEMGMPRLFSGETLPQAVDNLLQLLPRFVDAYLFNCSSPDTIAAALPLLRKVTRRPIGASARLISLRSDRERRNNVFKHSFKVPNAGVSASGFSLPHHGKAARAAASLAASPSPATTDGAGKGSKSIANRRSFEDEEGEEGEEEEEDTTSNTVSVMSPEEYAKIAVRWVDVDGANIVGGCCGVGLDHVAALSRRFRKEEDGDDDDVTHGDTIVAALGHSGSKQQAAAAAAASTSSAPASASAPARVTMKEEQEQLRLQQQQRPRKKIPAKFAASSAAFAASEAAANKKEQQSIVAAFRFMSRGGGGSNGAAGGGDNGQAAAAPAKREGGDVGDAARGVASSSTQLPQQQAKTQSQ